ncbi:hypothetical protein, partial [Streptococcus sp. HMSC034B05]|uniref:hypothetical protein n=1 Tax=Streptococcus sp. HMSC034B05 TaxID=1715022 RepID=UPI001C99799E
MEKHLEKLTKITVAATASFAGAAVVSNISPVHADEMKDQVVDTKPQPKVDDDIVLHSETASTTPTATPEIPSPTTVAQPVRETVSESTPSNGGETTANAEPQAASTVATENKTAEQDKQAAPASATNTPQTEVKENPVPAPVNTSESKAPQSAEAEKNTEGHSVETRSVPSSTNTISDTGSVNTTVRTGTKHKASSTITKTESIFKGHAFEEKNLLSSSNKMTESRRNKLIKNKALPLNEETESHSTPSKTFLAQLPKDAKKIVDEREYLLEYDYYVAEMKGVGGERVGYKGTFSKNDEKGRLVGYYSPSANSIFWEYSYLDDGKNTKYDLKKDKDDIIEFNFSGPGIDKHEKLELIEEKELNKNSQRLYKTRVNNSTTLSISYSDVDDELVNQQTSMLFRFVTKLKPNTDIRKISYSFIRKERTPELEPHDISDIIQFDYGSKQKNGSGKGTNITYEADGKNGAPGAKG